MGIARRGELDVDCGGVEGGRRLVRCRLPHAERRPGLDEASVGQRRPGRRHALERGHRGVPEGTTVPVRDSRIADVLMARRELTRRPLQEDARDTPGRRLDHLAHGADEVGRDEPVLPRQRGRVAGVVDEHGKQRPVRLRDPPDDDRVVGRHIRVEADHIPITVQKIAIGGEPAPADCGRQRRRNRRRDRLPSGLRGGVPHGVEVAGARFVAVAQRPRRARVRVTQIHEHALHVAAGRVQDTLAHERFVLRALPPSDIGGYEHERRGVLGSEGDCRQGQRAVDPGREVVCRGPPGPDLHAQGRCDPAPSDADAA